MKASELMIGDYIMTPLQKGTVIGNIEEIDTSFCAPDVCHITCDVGGYRAGFMLDDNRGVKPIDITEEILQRSGFERKQGKGYASYEINPYDGHIIEVAFYDSGIDVFIRFICGGCHLRSIKYFHELQNIVRVITGKELTIKDNKQAMNEVSIIINGVRYDAVDIGKNDPNCKGCELPITICEGCGNLLNYNQVFKKSDKKFEK